MSPVVATIGGEASDADFYRRHADGPHRRGHHFHTNAEMAEELWRDRCQGGCAFLAASTCYLFGGRGIASQATSEGGGGGANFYGDIARALADYFADFGEQRSEGEEGGGGGLDVDPSDVGLGLVVLRHLQAQRRMLAQRDALRQQQRQQGQDGSSDGLSLSPHRTALLFRWNTQRRIAESRSSESLSSSCSDERSRRVFILLVKLTSCYLSFFSLCLYFVSKIY